MFANLYFFSAFEFGYVVLPHQVGWLQITIFIINILFITRLFFLKQHISSEVFFAWAVVLSGAAFLRYTISDDIILIIFSIFFFFRSEYILVVKQDLIPTIPFFILEYSWPSWNGKYYFSIRFLVVNLATIIIYLYIEKNKEELLKLLEAVYWPSIFFVIMTYIWWVLNYLAIQPEFSILVGSLEGIGYAGTSHKEVPLVFLSIATLIKYFRTARICW